MKDTSYWHRKIMLDPFQQALKQKSHVALSCHTILKMLDPLLSTARREQRPCKIRCSLICFWSFDCMSSAWVSFVEGKMQNTACSRQVAERSWCGHFGEGCSVSCDLWAQSFDHMLYATWLFIFCLTVWFMKFDMALYKCNTMLLRKQEKMIY